MRTSDPSWVLPGEGSSPIYANEFGALYNEDCCEFLQRVEDESVDTIFADPPFNLGKVYGPSVDDNVGEDQYADWSRLWIDECIRVLKPGGSFFLFNLPRWNILFGAHMLDRGLEFRHWVAISLKLGLPIVGRLYPAHYSLLY